jgi:hypothetical protein
MALGSPWSSTGVAVSDPTSKVSSIVKVLEWCAPPFGSRPRFHPPSASPLPERPMPLMSLNANVANPSPSRGNTSDFQESGYDIYNVVELIADAVLSLICPGQEIAIPCRMPRRLLRPAVRRVESRFYQCPMRPTLQGTLHVWSSIQAVHVKD